MKKKIRGLKSTNPKAYWDILKHKQDNKNVSQISMEILKKHFEKLNRCETENKQNITNECYNNNNEDNTDFTLLELKSAIKDK